MPASPFSTEIGTLPLSLAEAIDVLPVPNHAQMKIADYIAFLHADQDALFAKIEMKLGFPLNMPLIGHPPVCVLNGTATSADMIRHAYPAYRMRQVSHDPSAPIMEIGGGFGSLALLAFRAGFRNYTVIDLPVVNAIQTFFLGSALGGETVSGYGEKPSMVRLLPPSAIDEIPDRSVALVFNMDSFPEIERNEGLRYLREIRRIAKYFLSINQEAEAPNPVFDQPQTRVSRLVDEVGGYERVYRMPYWMLEGYVEELYRIVP